MTNAEAVSWLKYLKKMDLSPIENEALDKAMKALCTLEHLEEQIRLIPCKNDDYCGRNTCKGCEYQLVKPEEVMEILR